MAVDDNMNTFWASKFDETSDPIEFVIDLGDVQRLSSIDISWEFPAKSFGIALSQDGVHFNEAFETDANILRTSRASLGMKAARKVRISMYEPNPLHGRFQGHLLYGIRSVSVFADRLRAVVTDCGKVGKSADARDKYFLVSASEFDASTAKSLKAEMPALEAAQAALSSTVSELVKIMPRVSACMDNKMMRGKVLEPRRESPSMRLLKRTSAVSTVAVGADDMDALLAEARSTIVAIRSALA